MFSRLVHTTRYLFSRPRNADQYHEETEATHQVRTELADAAAAEMVTTRRQTQDSQDSTLVDALPLDFSPGRGKKRKSLNSGESAKGIAAPADGKRRRLSANAQSIPRVKEVVEVEDSQNSDGVQELVIRSHDYLDQHALGNLESTPTHKSAETQGAATISSNVTDQTPIQLRAAESNKEVAKSMELSGIALKEAQPLRSRRKQKTKDHAVVSLQNTAPPTQIPKHKRFDGEEALGLETESTHDIDLYPDLSSVVNINEEVEASEEESDDEAPEIVSAAAGENQARIAAAEAASAAQR